MIEVEGPDGTIYEFPEGTDQATMKAALQKVYGAPQQAAGGQSEGGGASGSWADEPERTFGQRASGVLRAINRPIEAVNHGFTNMFMLGGLDELQGGIDAAMTDQTYGEAVQGARDHMQGLREDHPYLSTAAGVAGAIASPASQLAMRAFPAGGSIGKQMGVGAITGAALGGAQGYMEGEGGALNRLVNAGKGGALGAGLGGAMPAVFAGVGALYRGGRNALAERRGVGKVADELGISRSAGRLLSDTLGMDDVARMRNSLADAGQDAMLADAGPQVRNALDAVIQSPGEGARTALTRIDDRAAAAGQRLNNALDQSLTGTGVGAPSSRQFSDTVRMQGDIRASTAQTRKAVYDRAYAQPIDYGSPQGAALLDDISPRLPQEAVGYANKLMRMRGEKSPQIMASIADDGTVTFTNPPDVRQWDYIKQALDGLAESGDGAGALGGQTRMGAGYQGLARDIRRNLGEAVPDYDYAVNTAGDIIGEIRAIKTGETLLDPSVTRAEAEAALNGVSGAERAAIKRGLRQSIDDAVANVRAVASDPNMDAREAYKAYTTLTSRSSQDKMKMLLGDDWPKLKTAIDETASALGLRAGVSGNSATARRGAFNDMLNESTTPGRFARGDVVETGKGIWQAFTGSTPAQIQRARGAIRNELADVFTRPNPQMTLNALEAARAAHPLLPTAGRGLTGALNALGLSSLPAATHEARNRLLR